MGTQQHQQQQQRVPMQRLQRDHVQARERERDPRDLRGRPLASAHPPQLDTDRERIAAMQRAVYTNRLEQRHVIILRSCMPLNVLE